MEFSKKNPFMKFSQKTFYLNLAKKIFIFDFKTLKTYLNLAKGYQMLSFDINR